VPATDRTIELRQAWAHNGFSWAGGTPGQNYKTARSPTGCGLPDHDDLGVFWRMASAQPIVSYLYIARTRRDEMV
jgi:hypothetical protein